ncbi:MAG: sterol desaturase family protein [Sphingobacteriales bacterium]|nr:MAG: sterol desaturase family protein [Sphingobacteriales bacterium]
MDTNLREQILLLSQVPLYAIIIGIELFIMNFQLKKLYTIRETLQNIYLSLVCFLVDLGFRVVYLFIFAWCFKYTFVHWDHHGWIYWVSLVILQDLAFYWLHRNDHFIRFFWATHVTHHSAINYNITVGFRSSVLEPLYRFVYFIPLVFLGYEPIDILFVFSATQIWGTLIHTKAIGKLGFLEYIFVTPSHHRVHHASNAKYLDRNMGMFLIIWDKMFGTFQEEINEKEYEPIRYGLTHNLENPNWVMLIFHEFAAIVQDLKQPGLTWKQRWRYLFDKPGYSHDNSRMTSDKMRAEEAQNEIDSVPAAEAPAAVELVKG